MKVFMKSCVVCGCVLAYACASTSAVDIRFTPVATSDPSGVIDTTDPLDPIVTIDPGAAVLVEVQVLGWTPELLRTVQVDMDTSSLTSGNVGALSALNLDQEPPGGDGACDVGPEAAGLCPFCMGNNDLDGVYIDTCRMRCVDATGVVCDPGDFAGACNGDILDCLFGFPDFLGSMPGFGNFVLTTNEQTLVALVTSNSGAATDDGGVHYVASFVFGSSLDARGTFTIVSFEEGDPNSDIGGTLTRTPQSLPILPVHLGRVRIFVRSGSCCTDAGCVPDQTQAECDALGGIYREGIDCPPPDGAGPDCPCVSNADCDDGQVCNGSETCLSGQCIPGVNAPDGAVCDDGLFCTLGETCTGGVCGGGAPTVCDDGLPCTTDFCNDATDQCEGTPDAGSCLIAGVCFADGAINPANECEVCDSAVSQTDWSPSANGSACADDGDACTIDVCDGGGVCVHPPATLGTPCDDDGNDCTLDECDGAGQCTHPPASTGAPCADDGNDCTSDTCDGAGSCAHPAEPNGTPCDDGLPCTGTGEPGVGVDTCDGSGQCTGVLDPSCADTCVDAADAFEGQNIANNTGFNTELQVSCALNSTHDAWFVHVANCTGQLLINTTGSPFDTVLTAYDFCGGPEIACDDDGGPGLASAIVLDVTAGEDYFLRVAGFGNAQGNIVLNIARIDTCLIANVCHAAGATNPNNACEECTPEVSTIDWSPRIKGTPCGNAVPDDPQCDSPDSCDGAGVCESNHKPDGLPCLDEGNECTIDVCDTGVCSHPGEPVGTPCGDPTSGECDNPDTCDGSGVCEPNHIADGAACTDEGDACTSDVCDTGACTHPNAPVGTACGDPTDTECDNPDTCDGAGGCLANFEINGFACGDPADTDCDNPDTCDGAGGCVPNYEPAGFACGDPSDTNCDNPDICDPAGTCLPNFEVNGLPCDDLDVCTASDVCLNGTCVGVPIPQAPIVFGSGSRTISVTPQPAGASPAVALLVTSVDWPCLSKYVQPDGRLDVAPVFQSPDAWGTIVVIGSDIAPSSTYSVQAECGAFQSAAGTGTTFLWADVNNDGFVSVDDGNCILDFIAGISTCPFEAVNLVPCDLDGFVSSDDLNAVLDEIGLGTGYPCPPPCP